MCVSDDILKQVSEVYRKIRNTFRFLLGNVNDFDPNTDAISYEELEDVDKFMLNKFRKFTNETLDRYDRYDYLSIYQALQNFINVNLSNFYLDYGKDILYIEKRDAHIRRSLQTVLYTIVTDLNKLLAPVLVHTAEDIHDHTPHADKESVHLTYMPEKIEVEDALLEKWSRIMDVRDDVYKALEVARNEKIIGKSLDAKVTLVLPEDVKLFDIDTELNQLFIVSQVEVVDALEDGVTYGKTVVKVEHAEGEKCNRCWNFVTDENLVSGQDDVCDRCRDVVDSL